MSTPTNIERARQIVTAASQLAWSLYANGDLSVDQHSGIAYGLDVADEGIKAVEALVAERDAALADAAMLRAMLDRAHADVCSLHCPTVWRIGTPRPHSERCQAIGAVLAAEHPGAALLAVVAAARLVIETWAGVGDVTPIDLDLSALAVALGDYRKGVKERAE